MKWRMRFRIHTVILLLISTLISVAGAQIKYESAASFLIVKLKPGDE